jgi:deferrochelatase/peroxidase EfeB
VSTGTLQEGIYHAPGKRPGRFFAILFLRARERAAQAVGESFAGLWDVYGELKLGRVPDLPGEQVEPGALTVLVGVGPNAFRLEGAGRPLPAGLGPEGQLLSPKAEGGGPLLRAGGIDYAPEVRENPATEEIVVQAIADSDLAVKRLVVETWKHLHDSADPETGSAPLELRTFYFGFQRDDFRSWIDFHDGVSNLRSEDREDVIAIDPTRVEDEEWTFGGTYLAFIRLGVDLVAWRALDRREQEVLVGRDKLTGCPLVAMREDGTPVPLQGCPIEGKPIGSKENDPIAEPPAVSDPRLVQSHVQRANHHVRPASDPSTRRVFRQGYEFLEWSEAAPGFRAGLNFVSFQDTSLRLTSMLTQPGWLGATNFGGDPESQPDSLRRLLTAYAAGIYLVPPETPGERFPGAAAFGLG